MRLTSGCDCPLDGIGLWMGLVPGWDLRLDGIGLWKGLASGWDLPLEGVGLWIWLSLDRVVTAWIGPRISLNPPHTP